MKLFTAKDSIRLFGPSFLSFFLSIGLLVTGLLVTGYVRVMVTGSYHFYPDKPNTAFTVKDR